MFSQGYVTCEKNHTNLISTFGCFKNIASVWRKGESYSEGSVQQNLLTSDTKEIIESVILKKNGFATLSGSENGASLLIDKGTISIRKAAQVMGLRRFMSQKT